jgi:hypothetical protein
MRYVWNELTYCKDTACWMVHMEGQMVPMHCGEWMNMRIGERGIPCRLELDRDWYVILSQTRFYLRKKDKYLVEI